MPSTIQLLLSAGALCVSLIGVLCTVIALNRQKVTLVYDLQKEVAVLKSRMDAFSFVSEKWLANLLKAPTHYRLDTLLDKFTSQVWMAQEELEELEVLLEEGRYEPERFSGQKVALGLMKAFVIQRRLLHYPPLEGLGTEGSRSWTQRFLSWLGLA